MENNTGFTNKQKALSIYKWTLRKYMPFSIAYWILLLITLPIIEIFGMIATPPDADAKMTAIENYIDGMKEIADYLSGTFFAGVAILFSAILAIMAFSYMHNKRAVDFFGSFPVSRRTLFFIRYIAVIVASALPVVIIGVIGAFLTLSDTGMFEIFKVIGFIVLAIIGNVSMVAFISLCCGTVADVIICYAIINIVYPICVVICYAFPQSVIPGLTTGYMPDTMFTLFCPAAAPFVGIFGSGTVLHIVWWVLLPAVLMISCYILCRKRKAETAQNAFAFTTMEIVIKFITCFVTGFGCGWILSYLDDYNESIKMQYIWFVIGLVIGIMVTNILLHLIFHRGLAKYKKSFVECGVVFVAAMAFLVIVDTGAFGYDMRVPNAEKVESVSVNVGDFGSFTVDGIDVLAKYSNEKTIIQDAVDVHKQITELLKRLKHNGFYSMHGNNRVEARDNLYDDYDATMDNIKLVYKLSNGRTVTRYYYADTGKLKISKELKNMAIKNEQILERVPDRYLTFLELSRVNNGNISADVNIWNDENDAKQAKIKKILNALRKDIKEKGVISSFDTGYTFNIQYNHDITNDYVDCNINVPDTYENTIKALEETGYANVGYCYLKNYFFEKDYTSTKGLALEDIRTVYFEVPDNWDKNAAIQCMPSNIEDDGEDYEETVLTDIDDDITLCEKVSDNVWKYVIKVPKDSKDYYNAVMFYQIAEKDTRISGVIKLPAKEENNLLTIRNFPDIDDDDFYNLAIDRSDFEYSWDTYTDK